MKLTSFELTYNDGYKEDYCANCIEDAKEWGNEDWEGERHVVSAKANQ